MPVRGPKLAEKTAFRLRGAVEGEECIFLLDEGENLVGADTCNAIHIAVRQVSRRHAVLRVDAEGVRLEDLDSTNGTFVNGVRVRQAWLNENDWVQFGPVVLTFESLSGNEREIAIDLDAHPESRATHIEEEPRTTEIGIRARTTIPWAEILNHCATLTIGSQPPDVDGALDYLASATDDATVALLTCRGIADMVVVRAASGDLSKLDGWRNATAFDNFRPKPGVTARIFVCELATNPPATAAIAWGKDTWEAALIVAGTEIAPPDRRFLEVLLRMFRSATVPLSEHGRSEPAATVDDLEIPAWHVVGHAPTMRPLYRQIATLLRGDIPVLVTGETGVGKEHVVRILHASSDRANGPLQIVNCTAIPADLLESELFGIEAGVATGVTRRRGKLRLADGGILFLDEIGDMDPVLQAKLLRALQEGEVQPLGADSPVTINVRIIAATNKRLEQRVRDGRFRKDLYYRIAGCELHVPALRNRREDIPALARYFLQRACENHGKAIRGLSLSALQTLQSAAWPGNIRQLQRELTRLVSACPPGQTIESTMISPAVLTDEFGEEITDASDLDLGRRLAAVEKSIIEQALHSAGGNHSEAARLLGISRNGLTMKMKRLGIDKQRLG